MPYLCSPLSVVVKSEGKLCLVLNIKHLNKFLHVSSFKYEDLRTAALMFEKGEYMLNLTSSRVIIMLMCIQAAISFWASSGRLRVSKTILFLLYYLLDCPQPVICLQNS